jgi:hypothetical protein
MKPVLGDDGLMYYPVEPVFGRDELTGRVVSAGKRILCLPVYDFQSEYYIFVASAELRDKLQTRYAAVKITKETTADRDQWSMPAKGPSQGKTYHGG